MFPSSRVCTSADEYPLYIYIYISIICHQSPNSTPVLHGIEGLLVGTLLGNQSVIMHALLTFSTMKLCPLDLYGTCMYTLFFFFFAFASERVASGKKTLYLVLAAVAYPSLLAALGGAKTASMDNVVSTKS